MRSPVIAFGLFAAAAVSPSLVGAAPTSAPAAPAVPAIPAPDTPSVVSGVERTRTPHARREELVARAYDSGTAGGNAYTGGTSDTSGGNVVNNGEDADGDTLTNGASST